MEWVENVASAEMSHAVLVLYSILKHLGLVALLEQSCFKLTYACLLPPSVAGRMGSGNLFRCTKRKNGTAVNDFGVWHV